MLKLITLVYCLTVSFVYCDENSMKEKFAAMSTAICCASCQTDDKLAAIKSGCMIEGKDKFDKMAMKCTGKKELTDRDRFSTICSDEKVKGCYWEELKIKYNGEKDDKVRAESEDKMAAMKLCVESKCKA